MAKDFSNIRWHGVSRQEIPWYPTVISDSCIGCELCYVTCGRDVYEIVINEKSRKKAITEHPYNCMVACSTCAMVCPTDAIIFPSRDIIKNVEREFKILKNVRGESREKREKKAMVEDRSRAQETSEKIMTRLPVRVAGVFGEKRFLAKLEELIKNKPYDIENLILNVPTVKGLLEHTPAYMDFEITSLENSDITSFIQEVRNLATENELVWVEK